MRTKLAVLSPNRPVPEKLLDDWLMARPVMVWPSPSKVPEKAFVRSDPLLKPTGLKPVPLLQPDVADALMSAPSA